MKLQTYLIIGLAISMTACTQEDTADPAVAEDMLAIIYSSLFKTIL